MTKDTTNAKYRRRFVWLGTAILVAVAAYSGGWYFAAAKVDAETENAIATASRGGARVNCENRQVGGYPFRLGINCDSVLFEHALEGVSFSAGAFRTAAQIYNPAFLIGELDSPAHLEAAGLLPLELDWELLRSSVRIAQPLPTRISMEARRLSVATGLGGGQKRALFSANTVEAHMRPNDAALDLAARVVGLSIDDNLLQGEALPPVDGGLDLAIDDGVRWAASGSGSLRGQSGVLRQLHLSQGNNGSINARGRFSIDGRGMLDAELTITVSNAKALSQRLIRAFPESAGEITNFAASLEALGEDAELPLRVVDGRIIYGFIELGEIPPLP